MTGRSRAVRQGAFGALMIGAAFLFCASSAQAGGLGIFIGGPAGIGTYSGPIYPYGPGYNFPYPGFRYSSYRWYRDATYPVNPDPLAYPTAGYRSYYFPNRAYGHGHHHGHCR
ncbi:MAG: hypothetical protein U1D30_02860 [Planctomycetota bacterium]